MHGMSSFLRMAELHSVSAYSMRRMPTFGRDRIRRFWSDVSSRKQLAARDYEAFLMVRLAAILYSILSVD